MLNWVLTRNPQHLFAPQKENYGSMDFLCSCWAMLWIPVYHQNSTKKQGWLQSIWQAHHTGWRTDPPSCDQVGSVSVRTSTAAGRNISQRCVLLHITESKCVLANGPFTQKQWLLMLTDMWILMTLAFSQYVHQIIFIFLHYTPPCFGIPKPSHAHFIHNAQFIRLWYTFILA